MEIPQRLHAVFFIEDLVEYIFHTIDLSWNPFRPDPYADIYCSTPDIFKFNARFARAVQIASLVFHERCNTESTQIWLTIVNAPESAKAERLRDSFKSLSLELGSSSCTSFMFLAITVEICRRLYLSNDLHTIGEVIYTAAEYLTKLTPGDTPGMFSAMHDFASNFLETYDHQNILEMSSQEYLQENSVSEKMDENVNSNES